MKTSTLHASLALVIGFASATALLAADKSTPAEARVTVVFDHPEKYQDLKDSGFDTENQRGSERYLPLIKEHIEQEAGRLLAPGQRLTITFTDIDLAGDFEPWHGANYHDVRIVKDIYIPRLTFTFQVRDEGGRVLGEGERRLVDLAYQMRIGGGFRDDPLRYEKGMLNDWLRDELRARKG